MIQTSPRTRILLDLYKLQKISKSEYLKSYTLEDVLQFRLKRFISSKQIEINNELIRLNETKSIFINLVFSVFQILKFF